MSDRAESPTADPEAPAAEHGEEDEESPETILLGNPVSPKEADTEDQDGIDAEKDDTAGNTIDEEEGKQESTNIEQDDQDTGESPKVEEEVNQDESNDQQPETSEVNNDETNQNDQTEETNQVDSNENNQSEEINNSNEDEVTDKVDTIQDGEGNTEGQGDDDQGKNSDINQNDQDAEGNMAEENPNNENGETSQLDANQDNQEEETKEPDSNQDNLAEETNATNQDDQGEELQAADVTQDDQAQEPVEKVHSNPEVSPVQNDKENTSASGDINESEQDPPAGELVADSEQPQADPEVQQNAEEEAQEPVETEGAQTELSTDNIATGTEPTEEKHETDPHAPSPVSRYDINATATVKFVLMPSGQVATMRCHLGQTLSQLRGHFASELKMPTNLILILFDGKKIEGELTLGDLGVGPNGTIQLEIQSADPVNQPIKPVQKRTEYHMPDVITVRVQTEDGTMMDVVVEIERALTKKPFLGGYRHKNTGVEYHHASAQTMAKQRPPSNTTKYCRDTQTTQQRHQVQQTTNATSSQMSKIGVYVSNMEDKMVVPGKYTTADEHHKHILDNVVVIQKYYRRWLAMRSVDNVRKDKIKRMEWERQEEIRKKKEKEDRIRREFERRMNPKSKEDFDLLYHALEKWRKEELENINRTLTGAERKAALCQLLEQETQLIASVGRHKLDAEQERHLNKIQNFLDKAAAPKRWKGPDGNTTEMDTPYTIRAQQLRDIYNTINMKYLTQDERLDVLLTLKHTVKEHDCKLTQEIVELIDREADLLMRGVKEPNLEGLRKRISTLFLQYCKTPVFNPEIARLLKVPQDASTLISNINFCPACKQYLPSTEFQLSSNSRTVGRCRRCLKMDNDARVRQDYSHYRYMLKALRRSEEDYADGSKIAFLLQESDLRHLVENVWNSQSALSAWEDLYDLVLVRWDQHAEWSPWNCILLTKEEASAHQKLEDLSEAYGKTFVHKVKHRHTLARNYFSRLPGMAEHMRREASAKAKSSNQGPSITGKVIPVRVT